MTTEYDDSGICDVLNWAARELEGKQYTNGGEVEKEWVAVLRKLAVRDHEPLTIHAWDID